MRTKGRASPQNYAPGKKVMTKNRCDRRDYHTMLALTFGCSDTKFRFACLVVEWMIKCHMRVRKVSRFQIEIAYILRLNYPDIRATVYSS